VVPDAAQVNSNMSQTAQPQRSATDLISCVAR
jgi:hypothetical protein